MKLMAEERREGNQELLATAKAMTEATTELTSQLKQIGGEVTVAALEAKEQIEVVDKRQRLNKVILTVMFVVLVVLLAFAMTNRQLQKSNRAVLNRLNKCLDAITKCATDPPK